MFILKPLIHVTNVHKYLLSFFANFLAPHLGHIFLTILLYIHYIMCGLYGRAAAVVDSLFLQLLPSFSVPAYLLHLLTVTRPLSVVYTIICGCCQASPSLLTIAAFADEAAAQICSCWSAAAWLLIAAQALLHCC